MNVQQKILMSIAVAIISSNMAVGQTKQLHKSFKFGTIGYNLYTQKSSIGDGVNDTTFYLLYRVGNKKLIGKELKDIREKESGVHLLTGEYQLFPRSILFQRQGVTGEEANRKYTQNSKGLLYFEKYGSPIGIKGVAPEWQPPHIVDNTGEPHQVDIEAEFVGGMIGAKNYIARNLQYPDLAIENNVQGTVYATFVVTKDGSVSYIQIERGIGSGCDEEVVRVIKRMPKWKPAKLKGKGVNSRMRIPVSFKLEE